MNPIEADTARGWDSHSRNELPPVDLEAAAKELATSRGLEWSELRHAKRYLLCVEAECCVRVALGFHALVQPRAAEKKKDKSSSSGEGVG